MAEFQNYPEMTALTGDDLLLALNNPASGGRAVQKLPASTARTFFSPFLSVKDYGAVGDGTTDDAAAIQACIDAAISAGAYASVTRAGLATVFFPPGSYRVNTPLRVRSVLDFHMVGSGNASRLKAGASGMECILDLNGVANSSFKDFAFAGGAGFSATRALWLRWTGTNRSTSGNLFENLMVRDLVFTRAGFELGDAANPGVQVDNDSWVHCFVTGARTPGGGDVTNYQNGFLVGDGSHANNLLHNFFGCRSGWCRWNLHNSASQVAWFGGELSTGDIDVFADSATYTLVKGLRSEGSQRLLDTAGPASYPASVSLEDINWTANSLHPDDLVAIYKVGGTLRLANVAITYVAGKFPTIQMANPVEAVLELNGVSSQSGLANFVQDTAAGNLRVFVHGYTQVNSGGEVLSNTLGHGGQFDFLTPTLTSAGFVSATGTLTQIVAGTSGTTDAQNRVRGESAGYYFARQDGTQDWLIYRVAPGASPLFVRDLVNARMHATFTAGASNTAAVTELASEAKILGPLNHDGTTVGFYGAAPVTQPAANADTSGAVLADLETEVNQLKALLRSLGLMAT